MESNTVNVGDTLTAMLGSAVELRGAVMEWED